jgi:hypothetical protein
MMVLARLFILSVKVTCKSDEASFDKTTRNESARVLLNPHQASQLHICSSEYQRSDPTVSLYSKIVMHMD